jgi:AcrR family transcriptional regulator
MGAKQSALAGGRGGATVPTRQRILLEASELIAQQGYRATTTRQIAERVGVQQPSLFHHFASKADIVAELLEWDLGQTLPFVEELVAADRSPAERLYVYLRFDIDHLMNAPYNLAGVFTEDVMGDPVFAEWARRRARVHRCVASIVEQGVRSGDFNTVTPTVMSETVAGVLIGVLTFHSGGRTVRPELSDEVASVLLRGLLVEPARMPQIKAAAAAVLT